MIGKAAILLIRAYKVLISPWIGNCCRFHPSCSTYCIEAIERHGVLKGMWLGARRLGILGRGGRVRVASEAGARFLLIAAQPLNEPIARGGPFVMNTREEVLQAFDDYRHNRF